VFPLTPIQQPPVTPPIQVTVTPEPIIHIPTPTIQEQVVVKPPKPSQAEIDARKAAVRIKKTNKAILKFRFALWKRMVQNAREERRRKEEVTVLSQ
jgi:hypothetical protein